MKRTALYDIHKENNAKIVDFAGWQMPVVYAGIREANITFVSSNTSILGANISVW